jgi:hypothetical protein
LYNTSIGDLLQTPQWQESTNLIAKLWNDYLTTQQQQQKAQEPQADVGSWQATIGHGDNKNIHTDACNGNTYTNSDPERTSMPSAAFFTFVAPPTTTNTIPHTHEHHLLTQGADSTIEQLQPLTQALNATLIGTEGAINPPVSDELQPAGRFTCTYPGCNKSFSTSAILKRHIKEHSGERPFACTAEGCNKRFARKYDLKVHMRSHTGEKPYMCTFPGCERKFSRSSDLRLHERIHKGEKPFICDCEGCRKRFVRYADLKKHKRTHEVHEGHHPHQHGAGCGHTAIQHEDHIDYLHNNHLHNHHHDHIDDHTIGVTTTNPVGCKPMFGCGHHHHDEGCGHELVPHFDHFDFLVDGRLHYVHDTHCDDHGWIDVINWQPLPDKKDDDGMSSSGECASTPDLFLRAPMSDTTIN